MVNELHELYRTIPGALLHGDFTLSSGMKSDLYIDTRKVALNPKGSKIIVAGLLDIISDFDVEAVGGLENGAIPIVAGCVHKSEKLSGFFVRKVVKGHGTGNQIEGWQDWKRVIVLDDTTTTGQSLLNVIKIVRERCEVVAAVTVVDRDMGARELLDLPFFSLITIRDNW